GGRSDGAGVPVSSTPRDAQETVLDSFFFFQAEDGIRDRTVTGVQTCALPILSRIWNIGLRDSQQAVIGIKGDSRHTAGRQRLERSEERRVGKECRWRGRAAP